MATVYWQFGLVLLMVCLFCSAVVEDIDAGVREKRQQEKARFEFESANYTVNEQDGIVTIVITRTGNLDTSVSLGIVTFDDEAQANSDYIGSQQILTSDAGSASLNVKVPIIDDALLESHESFRVIMFRDPEDSDRICLGHNSVTKVTIVSNDDLCNPTPCGVNADCNVLNDQPVCSCPAGFTGNPFVTCIST